MQRNSFERYLQQHDVKIAANKAIIDFYQRLLRKDVTITHINRIFNELPPQPDEEKNRSVFAEMPIFTNFISLCNYIRGIVGDMKTYPSSFELITEMNQPFMLNFILELILQAANEIVDMNGNFHPVIQQELIRAIYENETFNEEQQEELKTLLTNDRFKWQLIKGFITNVIGGDQLLIEMLNEFNSSIQYSNEDIQVSMFAVLIDYIHSAAGMLDKEIDQENFGINENFNHNLVDFFVMHGNEILGVLMAIRYKNDIPKPAEQFVLMQQQEEYFDNQAAIVEKYLKMFYETIADKEKLSAVLHNAGVFNNKFTDLGITYPINLVMAQQYIQDSKKRLVNVRENIDAHAARMALAAQTAKGREETEFDKLKYDDRHTGNFLRRLPANNITLHEYLARMPYEYRVIVGAVAWEIETKLILELTHNLHAKEDIETEAQVELKKTIYMLEKTIKQFKKLSEFKGGEFLPENYHKNIQMMKKDLAELITKQKNQAKIIALIQQEYMLKKDQCGTVFDEVISIISIEKLHFNWLYLDCNRIEFSRFIDIFTAFEMLDTSGDKERTELKADGIKKMLGVVASMPVINSVRERERSYKNFCVMCLEWLKRVATPEQWVQFDIYQQVLQSLMNLQACRDAYQNGQPVKTELLNAVSAAVLDCTVNVNKQLASVGMNTTEFKITRLARMIHSLLSANEGFLVLVLNPACINFLSDLTQDNDVWRVIKNPVSVKAALSEIVDALKEVRALKLWEEYANFSNSLPFSYDDAVIIFEYQVNKMREHILGLQEMKDNSLVLNTRLAEYESLADMVRNAQEDYSDEEKVAKLLEYARAVFLIPVSVCLEIFDVNHRVKVLNKPMNIENIAFKDICDEFLNVNVSKIDARKLDNKIEVIEADKKPLYAMDNLQMLLLLQKCLVVLRDNNQTQQSKVNIVADYLANLFKTHVNMLINLSGADLSGIKLSVVQRSNISFRHCKLLEAIVKNCQLSGCNLDYADFSPVKTGTNNCANISGTEFIGCSLQRANFTKAIIVNCSFRGANLSNCEFQAAKLTQVDLSEAILEGVTFQYGATLDKVKLISFDKKLSIAEWESLFKCWKAMGVSHEAGIFSVSGNIQNPHNHYTDDEKMAVIRCHQEPYKKVSLETGPYFK
jgi:uncharacterized protein YjbI with pentapeptide repeats